jgi:hypothetical protein
MILENLKWIFSGIGVVIIVGLWEYFRRRRKRQPKITVIESHTEVLQQLFDPFEAVRIISAAPILQQDGIAKHYEGIRVDWTGTLDYLAKWLDKKLRLDIEMWSKDSPPKRAAVAFYVLPTEYTGLGLLKKGDSIRVSGIIAHASSVGFTLKEAKLISYGTAQNKE